MPHNKSCKKRVKTNEVRRQRNAARGSRMRHTLRDSRTMVQGATEALGDEQLGQVQLTAALLDRMHSKGLIHRNKAARLKSRLVRQAAAAGKN
ncbi:30S ribosomal protein S20 [bacterium]|nr:MAG: 30S ribosomal protein S20 [bacterium]